MRTPQGIAAILLVATFGALTVPNARADGPAKSLAEEQVLATILGSPLADWSFSRRGGADFDHTFIEVDGRNVLAGGPNATILDRKTPLENDTELRITLRLHHPEKKEVWYWLMLGHAEAAKYYESPHGLSFSMPVAAEQDWFYWNAKGRPARDGKPAEVPIQGRYVARELPKNRLTWPELVRARVEHEYASQPSAADRWLVIRVVFRKGSIQYYLDDRLLREATGEGVEGAGLLNMTLFDGVQLWSIRTRKLPPDDPRFVPVSLESDLNSSRLRGQMLMPASLPKPDTTVEVDGVPFVFPPDDEKFRNHIDLGASWLSSGTLDGQFDGGAGDLPRWAGALHRAPGRIQFRTRNGRYNKLHVLALASGEPNTTNDLFVQFFRAGAGHPIEAWAERTVFPRLDNVQPDGKPLKLTHLTIPVPQGEEGIAAFAGQAWLDFELTRELHPYRSFPDPIYYGRHAGGLPSGLHVFAMTLEKPEVEAWLEPDAFAHLWTAPDVPSYTVHLKNNTNQERQVPVALRSKQAGQPDWKGGPPKIVTVPPSGLQSFQTKLPCDAYGLHGVELRLGDKAGDLRGQYHFAHLHPDTRERGGWEEGKGPIFGFWDWNGGHDTPSGMNRLRTMVAAGAESSMSSFETGVGTPTPSLSPEERAYAEKNGMLTFFLGYQLSMGPHTLGGKAWDASKPAEMEKALIDWMKSQPAAKTTKLNRPDLAIFFAEPIIGPVSYMSLPHLYGEPEYQLTDAEKAAFQSYRDQFVTAARAIKREWPGTKCLFPWGLPLFPAAFLKDQEARELMDGPCLDVVLFERLPEMQLHQVTLSSQLWQLKQEWLRAGKTWPSFTAIEGPAISPARESRLGDSGALTERQEADHTIRAFMILAAYGTTRHLGWPTPYACAGSWGETHYGGGLCRRQPILSPKEVFCAYATMTRQLNRMNFVKQVPTGSNSVFCLQFKHSKTNELLHVFWTVHGFRPVTVEADPSKLAAIDQMDNPMNLDGKTTIRVSSSPCYVHGLADGAKITLGDPDYSNSVFIPSWGELVGNLGDGSWSLSTERDLDYENSHPEFVRRFPGKFSTTLAEAPEVMPAVPGEKAPPTGKKALAIHLEPQEKERKTMPFYTTVVPKEPIELPGTPSHLNLWVRAASDWGRVVYCLRDAKGERWISVGRSGEWNVDDVHCWSAFNFDGWRFLKFELPGNAPYDLYRYAGTSFWGNYGPGDAIVDYPLKLEKILVERRTHVIAGTEQVPADPSDVLLGQLFTEYRRPGSRGKEAVEQSRLRMPMPDAPPALENPLARLTESGTAAATTITKIEMPEREYDGRRCHVHFTPVDGAKSYTVWVSTYEDGRGAIPLGTNWTKPGELLTGLVPNIDLYLFVTYADKDGKPSKPSAPLKIRLKDMFAMK